MQTVSPLLADPVVRVTTEILEESQKLHSEQKNKNSVKGFTGCYAALDWILVFCEICDYGAMPQCGSRPSKKEPLSY